MATTVLAKLHRRLKLLVLEMMAATVLPCNVRKSLLVDAAVPCKSISCAEQELVALCIAEQRKAKKQVKSLM